MVLSRSDVEGVDSSTLLTNSPTKILRDSYNLVYIVQFLLGAGYLLPWNAFVTAVDYFAYLYPDVSVDRIFSVVYMLLTLSVLSIILPNAHRSNAFVRVNVGFVLFLVSLLVVPIIDVVYVKGRTGIYSGFYVTVGAVALAGISDGLVQGSIMGHVGELPERYMQATVLGTAASGFLVSMLRILTKAVYPQNPYGLRMSANLYFAVSIVFMVLCIVCYNTAHNLPVIKHYRELKTAAMSEQREPHTKNIWETIARVKWYGLALFLIYVVTLSIFPGYLTEDVHSAVLGDWYSVLLIAGYNLFDLIGKGLTAVCMPLGPTSAMVGAATRLLFFPLFYGCLHGPIFFRSEGPVTILTCLLGLSNGYLTSVLMIFAPKAVDLSRSELVGIAMVVFLAIGLASGSLISWFWNI